MKTNHVNWEAANQQPIHRQNLPAAVVLLWLIPRWRYGSRYNENIALANDVCPWWKMFDEYKHGVIDKQLWCVHNLPSIGLSRSKTNYVDHRLRFITIYILLRVIHLHKSWFIVPLIYFPSKHRVWAKLWLSSGSTSAIIGTSIKGSHGGNLALDTRIWVAGFLALQPTKHRNKCYTWLVIDHF